MKLDTLCALASITILLVASLFDGKPIIPLLGTVSIILAITAIILAIRNRKLP